MRLEDKITIPTYMFAMVIYNKGNKTASDVTKILDTTYSNIIDINRSLVKLGWAESKHLNKKSIAIVLTDKGKQITKGIISAFEAMGIVLKEDEENVGKEKNY